MATNTIPKPGHQGTSTLNAEVLFEGGMNIPTEAITAVFPPISDSYFIEEHPCCARAAFEATKDKVFFSMMRNEKLNFQQDVAVQCECGRKILIHPAGISS